MKQQFDIDLAPQSASPASQASASGGSWDETGSAFGGAKFMRLVHDSPAVPSVISALRSFSRWKLKKMHSSYFSACCFNPPPKQADETWWNQTTNTNFIPLRNSKIIHMNDNNDAGHSIELYGIFCTTSNPAAFPASFIPFTKNTQLETAYLYKDSVHTQLCECEDVRP